MSRTAVVTGASAGIGAEAARELVRRGWQVAVSGRHAERTAHVAAEIGAVPFVADFDKLDDVRALADALLGQFGRIDVLVNNAGGLVPQRALTADGHETTLQRNLLAGALLTELLLPRLVDSRARIVHTSSILNRFGGLRVDDLDFDRRPYRGGWRPYAASKLGVILYARALAARTGLENFAVHPGYVRSGFGAGSRSARIVQSLTAPLQISVEAGAAPLVHLVDTPELGVPNGTYFDGLTPWGVTHHSADDARLGDALMAAIDDRFESRIPSGDTA
jgi:NAD(P)-dependent dehydrogenase (short-subunit alcohol dehydrogenase family)